jgi:hypothetical protein
MYSDFDPICESCGWKRYAGRIGKGAQVAGACFHESERDALYCVECANKKNCCKFCGADLEAEYKRIAGSTYSEPKPSRAPAPKPQTLPLPRATLLGKGPPFAIPAAAITAVLAILVLAFVYAGYYFLVLRY